MGTIFSFTYHTPYSHVSSDWSFRHCHKGMHQNYSPSSSMDLVLLSSSTPFKGFAHFSLNHSLCHDRIDVILTQIISLWLSMMRLCGETQCIVVWYYRRLKNICRKELAVLAKFGFLITNLLTPTAGGLQIVQTCLMLFFQLFPATWWRVCAALTRYT